MDLKEVGILIAQIGGTEAVKKIVGTAIETHIKPILQKHADYKDNTIYLEECLSEYLENCYEKAMIMNTIVFRGVRKTIYDLYIPLSLNTHDGIRMNEIDKYIINDSYLDCISNYDKILIVDTAGMGKSTLVKYLSIQVINHNDYIPIIIELRKVDKTKELLDYIVDQFELLDKKIDKIDLINMLKRGDFIIFFDGYDEVTNENRGGILDNMQKFIRKAGNNKYIITSRYENDLSCLGDFQRFSISPLDMEEAFSLIRKYDNDGEKSKKLIERITNDKQLEILKEFLINPMLTSLLYRTFEYKEEIAYKKLGFYSQVYEALFNDHDKTKGSAYVHPKNSNLDILEFEKLLRRIAFISLKDNRVEYNRQNLVNIVEKCIKSMSWISAYTIDVIDDLTHAVPLFQKDGNDYKWVHKSFMEYFAAGYICYESNKTEELFRNMLNSNNVERYKNVLDFCYDMKPNIARQLIIYPHINNFINEYEKKYNSEVFSMYESSMLDIRKSIEYTHNLQILHYLTEEEAENDFKSKKSFEKIFRTKNNSSFINTILFSHSNDMVVYGRKNEYFVNELLSYKNIDIFKNPDISLSGDEDLEIDEGVYVVSDDALLKANKDKRHFDYITRAVVKHMTGVTYLDYNKCKLLKSKIELEIKQTNDIETEFESL
ncbi:NACHT domain-containing protein [Lacrimispora xylanisolvens]|uniref:NACHT domain-containing protein n=1 Tax=Lacrimispora xylanisolvens TaxID=384636 RepID=A0A2S6HQH5_9FIRM|nr:NACHT domain-containing protein [Hungatella xylanolytica]PPK79863.1 NACHT domain-containing protein [Hungatella xylanolytica]